MAASDIDTCVVPKSKTGQEGSNVGNGSSGGSSNGAGNAWFKVSLFLGGIVISGTAAYLGQIQMTTRILANVDRNREAIRYNQETIKKMLESLDRLKEKDFASESMIIDVRGEIDRYAYEAKRNLETIEQTQQKLDEQGKVIHNIQLGVTKMAGSLEAIKGSMDLIRSQLSVSDRPPR